MLLGAALWAGAVCAGVRVVLACAADAVYYGVSDLGETDYGTTGLQDYGTTGPWDHGRRTADGQLGTRNSELETLVALRGGGAGGAGMLLGLALAGVAAGAG